MSKNAVWIVEDPRYQSHHGPAGHPERPERLVAIDEALSSYRGRFESITPRHAEPEEILRVHRDPLLNFLASTRGKPAGRIDADTYYSSSSFDAACLAAGGSIELARAVMRGDARCGLAAVRPPGHHAEADRAMGFCLFNNIAIAARAVQAEFDAPKILILDWDVHHGNGTQHIFEDDPSVLYISTHQFPFYPGTGDFGEAGEGRGLGATLNIPMPAGCGDTEYLGILQRVVVPAAISFAPDLILVSCGFDAHRDDPLASMDLSLAGYESMTNLVRALADDLCGGRVAYVLEGGYALSGVREGTCAVLDSLIAHETPPLAPTIDAEVGGTLRNLVDRVFEVHGSRVDGLGEG